MENLRFYYEEFIKQLMEIELYIESIELERKMIRELENKNDDLLKEIETTRKYNIILKEVIASPIQYNAVIISIYGSFEQYIDNIFSSYCTQICEMSPRYEDLPKRLQEKHMRKLGDFLSNPQRYRNYEISSEQAISNAYIAFSNPKLGVSNNKSLVLYHGGNLRIDQISELASDLGIDNLTSKIINNYLFKEYCMSLGDYDDNTYKRLAAKDAKVLFESLEQLIEERNNVAHGWVENRIKYAELKDKIIGYIRCLAEVINDILLKSLAELKYNRGELYRIGKATKVFDNHIICINNGNVILKKGNYFVAVKDREIKVLVIDTLEINKERVENVSELNADIGIGFVKRKDLKVDEEYAFYCDQSLIVNN